MADGFSLELEFLKSVRFWKSPGSGTLERNALR